MKLKSNQPKATAEQVVKDIRRATRRHYSTEDKIRIVLSGLRGEDSIAELCRKEGIAQGLYYSWNNARIRAGLPEFRIHDLRHSFASCLVNAGRSLYEVQELLGHADIKTTSRYAHLSRERLIEAV
jgi:site-specific recombinase XerD